MKKLLLGALTACCALHASAAPVEDFIGTWKLERTSVPNGDVTIAAGETIIEARSVNDVATVTMLAEAYKKISSSTAAPTS